MENRSERSREKESVLLLHRGKRGLLRLVFSRTGVIVLLLAAQVLLLLAAFRRLGEYYYGSALTASLLASLVVINRPGDPVSKITWILLFFGVPVFGIPFYFYVNADVGHRLRRRQLTTVLKATTPDPGENASCRASLAGQDPGAAALAAYVESRGAGRLYDGSDVRYFPSGEAAFAEMLQWLERAERFIFLEYFIIEEGYMWGRILSVLERKARQGVEVRVLYDGTCVMGKLPAGYHRELEALGIRCRQFFPLRPLASTYYNNRDHRKIMVVDGQAAFTGGINLADEYINRRELFGHWKDTAVLVTGRAVEGFTRMFLQMWEVETFRREDYAPYLGVSAPVEGQGYVLPYGDQPMDDEQVAERVYLDLINRACRYVHIMTPYLALDNELLSALKFAAERGVEVRMILPGVPDKKTVFALGRSYYRELMAAGVEIWEYTPGFTHGKMLVSDDRVAVVGTVNLDYRSLYHHFECAALLWGCPAVAAVEGDMADTLAKCRRLTAADCRRDKLLWRLLAWFSRPLVPLI